MKLKKCKECNKILSVSKFRRGTHGYLISCCKDCEREYQREYQKIYKPLHKDEQREYMKRFTDKHNV